MKASFKDLVLHNGSIVKTEKDKDMELREIIPVKFIAKITTLRIHASKWRTASFVFAGLAAFCLVGGILAGDLGTATFVGTGILAIAAGVIYAFYKKNRHIGLRIKFSQGDDFKYVYDYSTEDYKHLVAFVDCVLKDMNGDSLQMNGVPEFKEAA